MIARTSARFVVTVALIAQRTYNTNLLFQQGWWQVCGPPSLSTHFCATSKVMTKLVLNFVAHPGSCQQAHMVFSSGMLLERVNWFRVKRSWIKCCVHIAMDILTHRHGHFDSYKMVVCKPLVPRSLCPEYVLLKSIQWVRLLLTIVVDASFLDGARQGAKCLTLQQNGANGLAEGMRRYSKVSMAEGTCDTEPKKK